MNRTARFSLVPVVAGLWLVACEGGQPQTGAASKPAPAQPASREPAATEAPPVGGESAEKTPPADADGAAAGDARAASTEGSGTTGPAVPGAEGEEIQEVVPPTDASKPLELPSFSTLVGDGPTVTITVKVDGAEAGELAFQTLDEDGFATMLHVQRLEGSSATVTAPARYADPIYVSLSMPEGEFRPDPTAPGSAAGTPERKGAGMQVAGAAEPVRLEGADVEVTITRGERPSWLEELAHQGVRPSGGEEAR